MKKTLVIVLALLSFGIFIFSCEEKDNSPIQFTDEISVYDNIPNQKLSLNVFLTERIEKEELENVAERIYKKYNGSNYKNVFIVYYLKGMRIGNGGYASTHFRPNLEIGIYGLTNEMIEKITQSNSTTKNYWIDDDWQSLATIRKINNEYELYRVSVDLSKGSNPLKFELNKINDTIFYDKRDSGITYYFKNKLNQIEVHDEKGLIYKMFRQ